MRQEARNQLAVAAAIEERLTEIDRRLSALEPFVRAHELLGQQRSAVQELQGAQGNALKFMDLAQHCDRELVKHVGQVEEKFKGIAAVLRTIAVPDAGPADERVSRLPVPTVPGPSGEEIVDVQDEHDDDDDR